MIPAAPPSPDASQEVLLRVEEPAIQCSSGNITDIDSSKAPMTLGNNDGACVYVCVCAGWGRAVVTPLTEAMKGGKCYQIYPDTAWGRD